MVHVYIQWAHSGLLVKCTVGCKNDQVKKKVDCALWKNCIKTKKTFTNARTECDASL